MSKGRALGIDWGEKRLGLALSDPDRVIASPFDVVTYSGKLRDALRIVEKVVAEYGVTLVVVGVPYLMSGKTGQQAQKALQFAAELKKRLNVKVVTWDERLTTAQAERVMREFGLDERKRRGKIDKVAAAILLDSYLSFSRNQKGDS